MCGEVVKNCGGVVMVRWWCGVVVRCGVVAVWCGVVCFGGVVLWCGLAVRVSAVWCGAAVVRCGMLSWSVIWCCDGVVRSSW